MTIDATFPPASSPVDDDQARFDLENSLTHIHGLAHVILALSPNGEVGEDELSYLGGRLIDHEAAAQDAFCRIFKLNKHSDKKPAGEKQLIAGGES